VSFFNFILARFSVLLFRILFFGGCVEKISGKGQGIGGRRPYPISFIVSFGRFAIVSRPCEMSGGPSLCGSVVRALIMDANDP
jgi:hypothetical protein